MGNYMSCSSSSCACLRVPTREDFVAARKSCMIMVVHSVEGRVVEVGGGAPMKVAELMLEFPGHFVSGCEMDTHDMKRASPLPADHEALPGRVYILFPMHKLHTRVPPHESSSYISLVHTHTLSSHLASLKKKKPHYKHLNGSKVTPLNMHFSSAPKEGHLPIDDCPSDDEIDAFLLQLCSTQQQKPSGIFSNSANSSSILLRSKSWIPKLETISESSILST